MRRWRRRDQHTWRPVQSWCAYERANCDSGRRDAVTDAKRRRKRDADPTRGDAIAISDRDADSHPDANANCTRGNRADQRRLR
jgi:hypothetical protein